MRTSAQSVGAHRSESSSRASPGPVLAARSRAQAAPWVALTLSRIAVGAYVLVTGCGGWSGTGALSGSPGDAAATSGDDAAAGGTTTGGDAAPDGSTSGVDAGTLGGDGGTESSAGGMPGGCSSLPPVTDYAAPGPFADAKMFTGVGPNNDYTLFRPDVSLGQNGFKHPIATWGNGILTTPDMYQKTLPLIASHGFVIIACNDTRAEMPCLSAGLDWLVQQNTTAGPLQGKLDTSTEVTIGYSWGGGAAIDTSVRPNVKATVSLHGMPPRQSGTWDTMHAPLLLTTSTGDNFVTASGYVTPNYNASKVQTFYATLGDATVGHLYVVDEGASICIGSIAASTYGNCGSDVDEHAPTIAWLRLWACGDTGAKQFFYGDTCTLCQSPWTMPQRKNWH
jgi:hypothetical protein